MTISQQAELLNIIQFCDLTAQEIETLRLFIEEVEDDAYARGKSDGAFETSLT